MLATMLDRLTAVALILGPFQRHVEEAWCCFSAIIVCRTALTTTYPVEDCMADSSYHGPGSSDHTSHHRHSYSCDFGLLLFASL